MKAYSVLISCHFDSTHFHLNICRANDVCNLQAILNMRSFVSTLSAKLPAYMCRESELIKVYDEINNIFRCLKWKIFGHSSARRVRDWNVKWWAFGYDCVPACASIAASIQRMDVSRVHFRITVNNKHLKLLNCKNHMASEKGNVVGVAIAFSCRVENWIASNVIRGCKQYNNIDL